MKNGGQFMKKIPKKKWFLVIAVVIFLIITFIRAQRPCVATSAFNFFYETKTEEGAKFKNVFSKTTVQVVYKDMSGLVTIKEGDKEYKYLVNALASSGITSINFTDLQSTSLEPHTYSYNRYTHNLENDSNVIFYDLPEGIGLEAIIQFGIVDTYSAMEGKDGLFGLGIFYFVAGFLLILFCKPLAVIDSYIADIFYKLEKPIKPRQWVSTGIAIIGGIFMVLSIIGLSRYIL